jgi:sterol desaturase/sphingolipid hydroxylase (fatty acid hydroxylase superfamily)
MNELLLSVSEGIQSYVWHIFYASTFCFLLELVRPADNYSMTSRVRGACFWLVYILITATFFAVFNRFWASLGLHPLITVKLGWLSASEHMPLKMLGWFAAATAAMTIGEFFYYWFHRLQHSNSFLWRFHAVHHSLREMSAWNNNHHFTEEIFRIPFVVLPTSIILQPDPGYVPAIIYTVLRMQGQFEHSSTKCHLGILRYIIADNRYHRIHHSVEREHFNKNFGSFTPLWDMIFGTARLPQRKEWPNVGLAEIDEPKTLSDFLWRPFRKRSLHAMPHTYGVPLHEE